MRKVVQVIVCINIKNTREPILTSTNHIDYDFTDFTLGLVSKSDLLVEVSIIAIH